jgi:hypothetical protein
MGNGEQLLRELLEVCPPLGAALQQVAELVNAGAR